MAVWQFDLSLLSRTSVLRRFGTIPLRISEFGAYDDDVDLDDLMDSGSFVDFDTTSKAVVEKVLSILPPMASWTNDAKMFGKSEGNKVEIWNDFILCRIDLRNLDWKFVVDILDLARSLDCVLVCKDNGKVLEPEESTLAAEISVSRAKEFLSNPELFLRKLGNL